MKARCIEVLQALVAEHQERRLGATEDVVGEFWRIRKLKYDYPDPPKVFRVLINLKILNNIN